MERIELPLTQVHAWIETLDAIEEVIHSAPSVLSAAENARADRFLQKVHADRYRVCHLKVRRILSLYTGVPPQALQFGADEFGKPFLSGDLQGSGINFNLSHSANRMLLGVVRDARIGVDIEAIDPQAARDDVAARFFTERENRDLLAGSGTERVEAFFRCWTRKEAGLKAIGCGLMIDPKECEVTLKRDETPTFRLLGRPNNPNWHLLHLQIESFIGAIALDQERELKQKSG